MGAENHISLGVFDTRFLPSFLACIASWTALLLTQYAIASQCMY
jgi:hypothetical protein